MSAIRVHNADHFEELRQYAIRESTSPQRSTGTRLSASGRHSFGPGSPPSSLSPTTTTTSSPSHGHGRISHGSVSNSGSGSVPKSYVSELLRENQQRRVAMKHEIYLREQEALQKKLAEGIAENLQKQRTKREGQYIKHWKDIEDGRVLAEELREKLDLQEQSRCRQFQRMHDEWTAGVFHRLNDPVVERVAALDPKALNLHKHETYQKFLDITNKKGALFRDIIIESEYNPLSDVRCLSYRTPVDDPVKRVIRRREEEEAIAREGAATRSDDAGDATSKSASPTRERLGREDNLDVKLWSRGVFESTPYGYFHKMMNSRPSSDSGATMHASSRVRQDHYNVERGADAVRKELPKGKRTTFDGYKVPKATIELR